MNNNCSTTLERDATNYCNKYETSDKYKRRFYIIERLQFHRKIITIKIMHPYESVTVAYFPCIYLHDRLA